MTRFFLFSFLFLSSLCLSSQVVINEVIFTPSQTVELINQGDVPVTVDTLWLCSFPTYNQIQNLSIESGSTTIPPGGLLVVSGHGYNSADDELGLYTNNGFSNSANIVDYVEWGSPDHPRSPVAIAAGIWTLDDFVNDVAGAASLEYDGTGDLSTDWLASSVNTQGEENSNAEVPCEASAFVVGNQSICPGETADFQMILTGVAPWTITYSQDGGVQDPIVTSDSPFIWQLAEDGTFILVSVSDAVCEGTAQGTVQVNLNDIPTASIIGPESFCSTEPAPELTMELTGEGPWEIEYTIDGVDQDPITINESPGAIPVSSGGLYSLTEVSDANCSGGSNSSVQVEILEVDGGDLSYDNTTDPIYTCVDDGDMDEFTFDIASTAGDETQLVITDETGLILSLPIGGTVDFEGSEAGICNVWNISYILGLTGLAEGNVVPGELLGCYSLSNPIEVIREVGLDCTTGLLSLEERTISIFPNPIEDKVSFQWPHSSEPLSVYIYSSMGVLVEQGNFISTFTNTIDLNLLAPGTYQMNIVSERRGLYQARFVK